MNQEEEVEHSGEGIEPLNRAFIHYEWAVMPSAPVCNSNLSLKWKRNEWEQRKTEGVC